MDFPVFAYSHAKISLKRGKIQGSFLCYQIFYFKPRRDNLTGLLFCLDLSLSRSPDHQDRNLHSLSLEVRPTTLALHLSVNMYVFNVKSYTECYEDKEGI